MKSTSAISTLDVRTRRRWRTWLEKHHDSVPEIWLIFHKVHTRVRSISYDDAVREALCYGWIDSLVRRLDAARYARKFTPRKADSAWSTANRRRYADLASAGLLAAPGRSRAPTNRSGDAPRPSVTDLPKDIEEALRTGSGAWRTFQGLAPSHRRAYIGWIDSAKREDARQRRLHEAVRLLTAGQTLGLK